MGLKYMVWNGLPPPSRRCISHFVTDYGTIPLQITFPWRKETLTVSAALSSRSYPLFLFYLAFLHLAFVSQPQAQQTHWYSLGASFALQTNPV